MAHSKAHFLSVWPVCEEQRGTGAAGDFSLQWAPRLTHVWEEFLGVSGTLSHAVAYGTLMSIKKMGTDGRSNATFFFREHFERRRPKIFLFLDLHACSLHLRATPPPPWFEK